MRFSTISICGYGCALLGLWGGGMSTAIAQTCVAQTTCPNQPIQFTPGSWVQFEVVNATGNIINVEEAQSTSAIALSPGQTILLGGTTTRNASLLFWDIQGLSLQARLTQVASNKLRVELLWGNGFGHYALYLRDDGRIELF